MPLDRAVFFLVLARENVLDALLEFENRLLVVRVDVEAPLAFLLEVQVRLGGVAAAVHHDEREGEKRRLGVAVGAVEEDSARQSVRVVRRAGLISDPQREVDRLVHECRASAV